MGKISSKRISKSSNNTKTSTTSSSNSGLTSVTKTKRTRKSIPRDAPPQRSSIYRGVTRAKAANNTFQKMGTGGRVDMRLIYGTRIVGMRLRTKKGRQVYLGAYDEEEAAAHAYDLAALKYWGQDTLLNFPLTTYEDQIKEMEGLSKEEYIGSLRRKSSGFSRGVSKYRGVARHHHNGRWEARIGRVFGNKYLYLGTYATQEEAATAYDMAAIEYRGLNAVTNFDLSRYIKWLRPNNEPNFEPSPKPNSEPNHENKPNLIPNLELDPPAATSSALGILLQSSKFKQMLEKTTVAAEWPETPPDTSPEKSPESSDAPRRSFPADIQTFFDCQESGGFADGEEGLFGDLNSFVPPIFQCEM